MRNFKINFTINDKYHSTTRTVEIEANNKFSAEFMAHEHFGSITPLHKEGDKIIFPKPSNKITINWCKELDTGGNIIEDKMTVTKVEKPKKPRKKKEGEKESDSNNK